MFPLDLSNLNELIDRFETPSSWTTLLVGLILTLKIMSTFKREKPVFYFNKKSELIREVLATSKL